MTGEQLKKKREALGLSQNKLGARLGIDGNTISRWERGTQNIQHPVVMELALDALQFRMDDAPYK